MSDPAVRTEGLTRDFGALRAVDQLSLEVPRGTVFGFLGPNGAVTTTTIRILLGLLELSDGRAEVLGLDVQTQAAEVRSRTEALLEHPSVYARLTGEENLEFHGRAWHLPQAEREARDGWPTGLAAAQPPGWQALGQPVACSAVALGRPWRLPWSPDLRRRSPGRQPSGSPASSASACRWCTARGSSGGRNDSFSNRALTRYSLCSEPCGSYPRP